MKSITLSLHTFSSTLFCILLASLLIGCIKDEPKEQSLQRWVGDISFDDDLDDRNFKVCHGDENILQYFNLGQGPVYFGEKPKLVDWYKSGFTPLKGLNQNGFVRIRFIVNCEGKSGRFRVMESDFSYNQISFDRRVTTQLLELTKTIENWVVLNAKDEARDYYVYLIFKIKDGEIIEILP